MKYYFKSLYLIPMMMTIVMFSVQGQKLAVDPSTHLVTYESIVMVDSMKADQIFNKTKAWFVEYFRSAKDVISGEVKPELIKGAFVGTYDFGYAEQLRSDITVRIKDGKLKIVIDHFVDAKPNSITGDILTIESYGVKDKVILRPSMSKKFTAIEAGCSSMIDNLQNYLRAKSDF